MDVALLSKIDADQPLSDDALLAEELSLHGVSVSAVSWTDAGIDWGAPGLCLVRDRPDSPSGRDRWSRFLDGLPDSLWIENRPATLNLTVDELAPCVRRAAAPVASSDGAGSASLASGESCTSIVYIDGVFTHAVRSDAAIGDAALVAVGTGALLVADRVVEEAGRPLFARVDLCGEPGGELRLCDVGLVDPDLFLRLHPDALARLARGVLRRLERVGRRERVPTARSE